MTATTRGAHAKTALDSAAKKFWESYWGPYGKDLVRDIKKRVLARLHATKRSTEQAEIRPLAFVKTRNGGFTLEAAVRSGDQRLLICASLSPKGHLVAIRGLDASGAFFNDAGA